MKRTLIILSTMVLIFVLVGCNFNPFNTLTDDELEQTPYFYDLVDGDGSGTSSSRTIDDKHIVTIKVDDYHVEQSFSIGILAPGEYVLKGITYMAGTNRTNTVNLTIE
ncbi:MAG: hypothetical protein WC162_02270 [Sphaerochaetaceae bacterium]